MQKGMLATLLLLLFVSVDLSAQQDEDALFIKRIHDHTLQRGVCYQWLSHLSNKIGGRLAGSPESEEAIKYTAEQLNSLADTVYLQECIVPYWVRGRREVVKVTNMPGGAQMNMNALALGNSVGTGDIGVEAEVIEVKSLDEVRELGRAGVAGKIVFYNRPMDPTLINTFQAYGRAGDQRVNGPAVAAEYGAVGAVVRSLTTLTDNVPHTGVTRYKDGVPQIPAVAISTEDADKLSYFIKKDKVSVYIETHCKMVAHEKLSHNVVAEIKGSEYPDEIILVGGHMDSWDVAGGAHDDGAGCVHAMQVLQTMQALGYQPKRTIRCVLFMNEENGLGGGLAYAAASNENDEFHLAAIESDAGGFSPRAFSFDATDEVFAGLFRQVTEWEPLLAPYGIQLNKGGSGADINPLKSQNGLLAGLRPDSQRYFDFHHTKNDNIEAVNERELKLGAAAMSSLVYLLDQYGLQRDSE